MQLFCPKKKIRSHYTCQPQKYSLIPHKNPNQKIQTNYGQIQQRQKSIKIPSLFPRSTHNSKTKTRTSITAKPKRMDSGPDPHINWFTLMKSTTFLMASNEWSTSVLLRAPGPNTSHVDSYLKVSSKHAPKFSTLQRPFFICPIKSIKISSLKDETRIVSVDLQKMAPIFGVTLIEGDITKDSTVGNFL